MKNRWLMIAGCCVMFLPSALSQEQRNSSETSDLIATNKTTRVVASVIGYMTRHKLPTGERIAHFSIIPENRKAVAALLFQVIEPTNLNRCIYFMHHDGYLASGDATELYEIDKKYWFDMDTNALMTYKGNLCSLGPRGQIYFSSRKEIEDYISGIKTNESNLIIKKKEYIEQLDKLTNNQDQTEASDIKREIESLNNQIWYLSNDVNNATSQLNRFTHER